MQHTNDIILVVLVNRYACIRRIQRGFYVFFDIIVHIQHEGIRPGYHYFPSHLIVHGKHTFKHIEFHPFDGPFITALLQQFTHFFTRKHVISACESDRCHFLKNTR